MSKLLKLAVAGSMALLWGLPGYTQSLPAPFEPPPLPSPSSIPSSAPGPSLSQGAVGEDVEALQQALDRLGYDPGPVDGAYGPLTRDAVMEFQQEYGLSVTGVAGPDTLDVLGLYEPPGRDTVVVEPPPPTSRGERSPYVAAITESSRKLSRVQRSFGNATLDSARPGQFINIGRYRTYSGAADRVREARRLGFDARIIYQRQ